MQAKTSSVDPSASAVSSMAGEALAPSPLEILAERRGRSAARRFFAAQGFPLEVRLNEETLSLLLATAIECGAELATGVDGNEDAHFV